jgi:hypothetical protein
MAQIRQRDREGNGMEENQQRPVLGVVLRVIGKGIVTTSVVTILDYYSELCPAPDSAFITFYQRPHRDCRVVLEPATLEGNAAVKHLHLCQKSRSKPS